MDNAGLMAPIPSRERAEYDAAEARKRGLYGLMVAVADPFSYVPGPVGDVAQVAKNIGEKGPLMGLLSSWDVVGMPKILRKGPEKLSMYGRSKVKFTPEGYAGMRELGKDIHSKEARSIHDQTGRYVDVAGNLLEEFSDARMVPTKELASQLAALMGKPAGHIATLRAKDLFEHPELYQRYPTVAEMPISLKNTPSKDGIGGTYWREKNAIDLQVGKGVGTNAGRIIPVAGHEFQHAIQALDKLPRGADFKAIERELVAALQGRGASPQDIIDLQKEIQRRAYNRYWLTEGEIGARTTQLRQPLTQKELGMSYPHDTVRFAGGEVVPSASRIVQPYDPDAIDKIAERMLQLQAKK